MQTATVDEVLGQLKTALSAVSGSETPELNQAFASINDLLAQGRYKEVEEYLLGRTSNPFARNQATVALAEQLRIVVHAEVTASELKLAGVLDPIMNEACTKLKAGAPASEFDPLLRRLSNLQLPAGLSNLSASQQIELARSFLNRCQDYVMQNQQPGAADQADAILNDIIQIAARLPAIPRSQLLEIQAEAAQRSITRNATAGARLENLKKLVATAFDSAKVPADLDPVLAELAKPSGLGPDRYGNPSANLNSQFELLRRYARRWQDYLSQLEAGNGAGSQSILRDLAGDNNIETFYPRSRILARINGQAVASTSSDPLVTAETLSLDTLEKFNLQAMARQTANGRGDVQLDNLVLESANLIAAENQLKIGNPRPAIIQARGQNANIRSGPYALAFGRMQQALLLRALPIYIGAPAGLTVTAQETAEAYLQRVIGWARDRQDWQLVYRALDTAQTQAPALSNSPLASDLNGYRLFFTGMNQERGEQWTLAIRSYLSALNTDAPNLPAEEIGNRLKKLKAAHPQEYDAAEKPAGLDPRRGVPGGLSRAGGVFQGEVSGGAVPVGLQGANAGTAPNQPPLPAPPGPLPTTAQPADPRN